jgi:hypothetical protein
MLMLFVKHVVLFIQSTLEIPHVALRMQLLPRPRADSAFTALERKKQTVESGGELVDGPMGNSSVGVVQVVELVGVVLGWSV